MSTRRELELGMTTAFIDSTISSNLAYKPQFVFNNHAEGRKVLSSIEDELLRCEEFYISVAFITMGGITPLLQALKLLENRGVKGRILTTNYLNFTEPRALSKLQALSNLELRMYDAKNVGFHTKGYIFKKEEVYRIIVGSSNMTSKALTINKEWNSKIISTSQGEFADGILNEFESLWNADATESFDDFIGRYTEEYEYIKKQNQIAIRILWNTSLQTFILE